MEFSMRTKSKIIVAGGILALIGFLVVLGLGDRGAVDLYRLKIQKNRLEDTNLELEKKNRQQYRIIERLKHDPDFAEHIARTEHGMVREDEIIILKKDK